MSADIKFTTRTKNTKNCVKLPERTNSEDKLLIKRNVRVKKKKEEKMYRTGKKKKKNSNVNKILDVT